MIETVRVHRDITAIPTFHRIPGVGVLTINSFVLHAEQPMIVDTGTVADTGSMVEAIASTVQDPRWLWITHTDADHIGSVGALLAMFPELRVVTTYTGVVKLSTHAPVPMSRVRIVNPGESLDLGDRTVTAVVPPLFDAPETTGLFDPASRALFSSDCFGAILPPGSEDLSELSPDEMVAAQTLWTSIDTPWVNKVDRRMLEDELEALRRLDIDMILSGHFPATSGIVEQQLAGVSAAPEAPRFEGLSHQALMSMGR